MSATHIAIVDDEPDITQLLAGYLGGHGYRVSQVHTGAALKSLMASDAAELVLLDLGLGREDGLVLARYLREHWGCGLVIVTGRGDAVDKVVGLEVGADDYVTKPFDLRELLARIKAVLRRVSLPSPPALAAAPTPAAPADGPSKASAAAVAASESSPMTAMSGQHLHFAGWTLDTASRRLLNARGDEVPLTGGEFDLLRAFALHPGRVLSRDFLLEFTRGREAGPYERTIDVQVGRLRKKIEADADNPQIIKSVRGAGYVMSGSVTPL